MKPRRPSAPAPEPNSAGTAAATRGFAGADALLLGLNAAAFTRASKALRAGLLASVGWASRSRSRRSCTTLPTNRATTTPIQIDKNTEHINSMMTASPAYDGDDVETPFTCPGQHRIAKDGCSVLLLRDAPMARWIRRVVM